MNWLASSPNPSRATTARISREQQRLRAAYYRSTYQPLRDTSRCTSFVGGCAGDGLRMQVTKQLLDDEVLTDAIVSAAGGRATRTAPPGGWPRQGFAPP